MQTPVKKQIPVETGRKGMLVPVLCVFFLAIPPANAENIDKLITRCSRSESKACQQLASAVGKLSNQDTLAKIAADNRVPERIRLAANAKLSDQAVLADLAVDKAVPRSVREAAVEKLTDQALLARLSLEGTDGVSETAIVKLTDQAVLARLAVDDKRSDSIRLGAIKKLTDQALLTKLAVGGEYFVGPAATARLTDQATLAKLAGDEKGFERVRVAAVEKLKDQVLLEKLAVERMRGVRLAATAKLTNQVLLAKIAGDFRRASVSPEEAAARIRLVLQDPILSKRIPNAEFRTHYWSDSEYYTQYAVFPDGKKIGGGSVEKQGEIIRFDIWNGSTHLTNGYWRSAFPREMAEWERVPDAVVNVTSMMGELFCWSEIAPEDLAQLTRSQIPEVRAGALANLPRHACPTIIP